MTMKKNDSAIIYIEKKSIKILTYNVQHVSDIKHSDSQTQHPCCLEKKQNKRRLKLDSAAQICVLCVWKTTNVSRFLLNNNKQMKKVENIWVTVKMIGIEAGKLVKIQEQGMILLKSCTDGLRFHLQVVQFSETWK